MANETPPNDVVANAQLLVEQTADGQLLISVKFDPKLETGENYECHHLVASIYKDLMQIGTNADQPPQEADNVRKTDEESNQEEESNEENSHRPKYPH